MEERQTGRTTALLEQALRRAKAGDNVVFTVAHAAMRDYAHRLAEHLAKARLDRATGKSDTFAGTLRIVPRPREDLARTWRGVERLTVIHDHYWEPRR